MTLNTLLSLCITATFTYYNIHSVSTISSHKADYQSCHPVLNEPDANNNNNSIFTPEQN